MKNLLFSVNVMIGTKHVTKSRLHNFLEDSLPSIVNFFSLYTFAVLVLHMIYLDNVSQLCMFLNKTIFKHVLYKAMQIGILLSVNSSLTNLGTYSHIYFTTKTMHYIYYLIEKHHHNMKQWLELLMK